METVRSNWETERLVNSTVLPLVVLRLAMGDRIYGVVKPNAGAALSAGYYDADVFFDADVLFNADGGSLEDSARLVSVDAVEQTSRPIDTNVLGSFSQGERPSASFVLDNGDKEMSKIAGQEYILRQEALVYATFPGLDTLDALLKSKGSITTWTLTKASFRVEFEGL